jgi:Tol biopolymer transport system component
VNTLWRIVFLMFWLCVLPFANAQDTTPTPVPQPSDYISVYTPMLNEPDMYAVYVYYMGGGPVTTLQIGPAVSFDDTNVYWWAYDWSPDTRWLAFAQRLGDDDPNDMDIYAHHNESGTITPLVSRAGADIHPSWSPDGTRIAFWSADPQDTTFSLSVVDVATQGEGPDMTITASAPRLLLADVQAHTHRVTWSPDGRRMAFAAANDNGDYDIFTINADGTDFAPLLAQPRNQIRPAWSPDGTRLVLMAADEQGIFNIHTYTFATQALQRLTTVSTSEPSWSPTGRRIIYTQGSDVYIMDADGRNAFKAYANAASPRWLPANNLWAVDRR